VPMPGYLPTGPNGALVPGPIPTYKPCRCVNDAVWHTPAPPTKCDCGEPLQYTCALCKKSVCRIHSRQVDEARFCLQCPTNEDLAKPSLPANGWISDPFGRFDERRRINGLWSEQVRRRDKSSSIPTYVHSKDALMIEAGWYSDPISTDGRRFWDSACWTNYIETADGGRIHQGTPPSKVQDYLPGILEP
jgi:Protein of unknown function (DUF2510)